MDKPTRTPAIPTHKQPLDNIALTQGDVDSGTLIAPIGIAPLKPAEYIDMKIQDWPDAYPSTSTQTPTQTPGKPPFVVEKRKP
jgi:hypothetical protein